MLMQWHRSVESAHEEKDERGRYIFTEWKELHLMMDYHSPE